jgi:hypothetical protein
MYMKKTIFMLALFISADLSADADTDLNQGFEISNANPLLGVYGVAKYRPTNLPEAGQTATSFQFEIHNHFVITNAGAESLFLDGETYVATLGMNRGLSNGWSVGLDIPVVSHQGGFLDGFIDNWHDWFGLDSFDRGDTPEDQLSFRYRAADGSGIDLAEDASGVGDIVLRVARQLGETPGAAALTIDLKLPTGDADELTGSGGTDLAVALQGRRQYAKRSTLYGGVGVAFLEKGEVLEDLQKEWAASASLGFSWQGFSKVALKVQLDAQSAIYENTEIEQLSEFAMQLSLGGSVKVGKRGVLDIAIIEDEWKAGASPDFGFLMRYRRL